MWRRVAFACTSLAVLLCVDAFTFTGIALKATIQKSSSLSVSLRLRQATCASRSIKQQRHLVMQSSANNNAIIALTREAGKNTKLEKILVSQGLRVEEIPCIAFEDGPDKDRLPAALVEKQWEYVVITSPEAADVFLDGWEKAGRPAVRVASVGSGTEQALRQGGVDPVFKPSKATGKTLAAELPGPSAGGSVLYPASSKAKREVQDGLAARGFACTRLDTYDTVAATWTPQQHAAAAAAAVVTLASPSAVKVWAERVGTAAPAACIGETSAAACREAGFRRVYWPDSPGIDGWAAAVLDALKPPA
jgi:uroporphyrinogen-III synthase